MKRTVLGALVALLVAAGLVYYVNRPQGPLPQTRRDVVALWLEPVPEGPVSARFVLQPAKGELPLDAVAEAIPSPLPREVGQGLNCDMGGDLVVRLEDGEEIRYGPCRRPPQIEQLRKEMLQVLKG